MPKMPKTYTTISSLSQGYPFNLYPQSLPNFQHIIQIRLPIANRLVSEYNMRLKKITELELFCSYLIKLYHVMYDSTKHSMLLTYEPVPFTLGHVFDTKIQFSKIYSKIHAICQFLLQKKILPVYDPKSFGFTQNHELKYFLDPDYQQIINQHDLNQQFDQLELKVKMLLKSIKPAPPINQKQSVEDDKNSVRISERDLSAYNKKFEQKISQIQSKLLLNKQGNNQKLGSSQNIHRRKKLSHNFTQQNASISSSSSNSAKFPNKKAKDLQQEHRNSYNNEYEQRNSRTSPQRYYIKSTALGKKSSSQEQVESPQHLPGEKNSKLTNSLIIQEKNEEMQKLKHHKSSFGDYSNYGNQSEKEIKLKRRISFALEKSQNALKVYEKYQSMRTSHPRR